jgi:FMN phosphatase YigB (HAD superfamily)
VIRAVFFDIGETLVDESRSWLGWADWLGVPAPEAARAHAKIRALTELPGVFGLDLSPIV